MMYVRDGDDEHDDIDRTAKAVGIGQEECGWLSEARENTRRYERGSIRVGRSWRARKVPAPTPSTWSGPERISAAHQVLHMPSLM
jgi:hypothetical protein